MPQKCKVFSVGVSDLSDAGDKARLDELIESKINTWLETIQSQKGTTHLKISKITQSQNERVIVITIFYDDGKFAKRFPPS